MAVENSIPVTLSASLPTLPAPFDDVRFEWDVSDRCIELKYIGEPGRLIECGAIEPHMAVKREKGGPKPRLDSRGDHFLWEMKVVRRPKLSAALQVVRYITDSRFAESLPGVPCGLRFKRLDWLDAHPGELHITTKSDVEGVYIVRQKWLAGTRENLVAIAGYSEKALNKKMVQRVGKYNGISLRDEDGEHIWATRLMRGYYEIRTQTVEERPNREEATASQPRPSHLRLVVDNDSV